MKLKFLTTVWFLALLQTTPDSGHYDYKLCFSDNRPTAKRRFSIGRRYAGRHFCQFIRSGFRPVCCRREQRNG